MSEKFEQIRQWSDNFTYIRKIILPRLTKSTNLIIAISRIISSGIIENILLLKYNFISDDHKLYVGGSNEQRWNT